MVKVLLDPGHGKGINKAAIGYEGDNVFRFSKVLEKKLAAAGFVVGNTRKTIYDNPSLAARGKKGEGFDILMSLHTNAAGKSVRGTEIFNDVNDHSHELAKRLTNDISNVLDTPNRGVKYKTLPNSTSYSPPKGRASNWYGVLRYNRAKIGMLIEFCFHTNYTDCKNFLDRFDPLADAIVKALMDHYGLHKPQGKTKIISTPTVNTAQMTEWAILKKADQDFIALAPTFYRIARERGIDPAVVYAQSAKETGYFKFGGVITKDYHNPCGLKTTKGGGNNDPSAHKRFKSWDEGITAQVDHLALYAGQSGYPKKGTPDPRHFSSIRGTAKTVEDLGGRWAPSANYGREVAALVREIQAVKATPKEIKGDRLGRKPVAIISILERNNELPDLAAARIIKDELYPTYNAIITVSGAFDYADIDTDYIIAVGGSSVNHTSYKTHFVAGIDRYDTKKRAKDFKYNHDKYKVI